MECWYEEENANEGLQRLGHTLHRCALHKLNRRNDFNCYIFINSSYISQFFYGYKVVLVAATLTDGRAQGRS